MNREKATGLLHLLFAVLGTLAALRMAVSGTLPGAACAFVVPATCTATVVAAFRVFAVDDPSRPLLRRHGFWVVLAGLWLLLPRLGSFGLTDPWETHYAEVAREMLARKDFISPWWAHDGLFMSKPVLIFWLEALCMRGLGVDFQPDRVLPTAAHLAHPEWAVRLPAAAFAVLGAYFLYLGMGRAFGRRAAFFSSLVLLSSPGFALVAKQAITDMPLVGALTATMGLLMVALSTDDGELVRTVHLKGLGPVHAGQLVAIVYLVLLAPQLVYLASRQVELGSTGLHLHADAFFSGSAGNCALPGQLPCKRELPVHSQLSPLRNAALWLPVLAFVFIRIWRERRVPRVAAFAAAIFAALGTMAKGPAALAIPAGATLIYLVATKRPKDLFRLELLYGLAIVVSLTLPWYLAVYARHGRGFIDELVMRHMFGRTLTHLHDTNDGLDTGLGYYVEQLGVALFPWGGLGLAGLGAAFGQASGGRARGRTLLVAWAVCAFTLVSAMQTKFHHYMLPVLPPMAALAGLFVSDLRPQVFFARARQGKISPLVRVIPCLGAAAAMLLTGASFLLSSGAGQARLMQLFTYRYDRPWPETVHLAWVFALAASVFAIGLLALGVARLTPWAPRVLLGAAAAFAVFSVNIYLPAAAPHWGQRPVVDAYYTARGKTGAPLVAYQMNWKGENFYTGNHVAIFVSSGAPMKTYLDARRARGEREVFFVTERVRLRGLRAELGNVSSFAELTTPAQDLQFCLVRAVL